MQQSQSKNGLIAVIVLAVVLFGGIGVYAISNSMSDDEEATTSQTQTQTSETTQMAEETKPSENIVGLASGTASLSTLVSAVQAADLVSTLQGEGPFTVFAPTNDAFSKLPAGTLDNLLLPENKATLAGILTYHVVAGKVMSKDLSNGQVVTTVQGENLTVEIMDGKVMLVDAKGGKATVAQADIEASNGVVHVIDSVVLPQ